MGVWLCVGWLRVVWVGYTCYLVTVVGLFGLVCLNRYLCVCLVSCEFGGFPGLLLLLLLRLYYYVLLKFIFITLRVYGL